MTHRQLMDRHGSHLISVNAGDVCDGYIIRQAIDAITGRYQGEYQAVISAGIEWGYIRAQYDTNKMDDVLMITLEELEDLCDAMSDNAVDVLPIYSQYNTLDGDYNPDSYTGNTVSDIMAMVSKDDLQYVAKETIPLDHCNNLALQVAINIKTGQLHTNWCIGNNWTVWHDPDTLNVCRYVTTQDVDHVWLDIYQALTVREVVYGL